MVGCRSSSYRGSFRQAGLHLRTFAAGLSEAFSCAEAFDAPVGQLAQRRFAITPAEDTALAAYAPTGQRVRGLRSGRPVAGEFAARAKRSG